MTLFRPYFRNLFKNYFRIKKPGILRKNCKIPTKNAFIFFRHRRGGTQIGLRAASSVFILQLYITGIILWVVYCGFCIKGKASPRNFSGRRFLFIGIFPLRAQIYPRFIGKFSARIADTSKKALSAHERKPFSVLELFHHDFGLFKLF